MPRRARISTCSGACLDDLPEGEPDLLGPALDAALDKLTALPDPEADSDCGVQLMTIHKAKGLEFEIVIVPDLQAGAGEANANCFPGWSGACRPMPSPPTRRAAGEITEFLVAPFQRKGADSGKAKQWVDRVRRERESQEARRLLYVAATRAREELHLFARPSWKTAKDGSFVLAEPRESLLLKAWPAWEAEIRRSFDEWIVRTAFNCAALDHSSLSPQPPTICSKCLLTRPSQRACVACRPASAANPRNPRSPPATSRSSVRAVSTNATKEDCFRAHSATPFTRFFSNSRSFSFRRLAMRLSRHSAQLQPRIAATIRAAGIEPATANRIAAQALEIVLQAAGDPLAQWILAPHADAASEVRWTGVVAGSLRTVQVDRVFRAGPAPQMIAASPGEETWWIIDYKTAHEDGLDPASALPELRRHIRAADRGLRSRPPQPARRRTPSLRGPLLSAHGAVRLLAALGSATELAEHGELS